MKPGPSFPVDNDTAPRPSAVRQRILDEHARLRPQLVRLQELASWLREAPAPLLAVKRVAQRLLGELEAHTRLEDAVLAPVLRDVDAWGPIRESELLTHHIEQRDHLHEILAGLDASGDDFIRVAELTLAWTSDVLLDMDHEEQSIIHQNLLRDDLVTIDGESG
jgi:hypothetical protein